MPSQKTAGAIRSAIEIAERNGFNDLARCLGAILKQPDSPPQDVTTVN